jgi:hypothetical protein
MHDPIEISDIANLLKKLANTDVILPDARKACGQAASLLTQMREIILTSESDVATVERLKWILVQQGEG